jgi:excisionase family DNA binding protein
MALRGLGQLVEDPDRIVTIPPAEIPRLMGDAEAVKAGSGLGCRGAPGPPPMHRGHGSHRLLTAPQGAERLDVTLARLDELVRTGTLPAVRIGRQIRFSHETLAQWIDDGGTGARGRLETRIEVTDV